ncbi:NAD-dependent epimerase/dehydratase family protein, partial [Acinetobacter baumannii]
DNLSTGFRNAIPESVPFVLGDVADSALVNRILTDHSVSTVIHFAGSAVVTDSMTDPLGYYANNTCASRSLIEAAVRNNVRHFIFSSTAAIYG